MPVVQSPCPVTRVTEGPFHHFFGYYDKFPWDASGRHLLALRVAFMDRPPTPQDSAVIGSIDRERGNLWRPLAETTVWNWQQGTHLQWLGSAPDRLVAYNTRDDTAYRGAILDSQSGERRLLPRPIYALSPDGRQAVTLNFSRVHRCRPGYGYAGIPDAWLSNPAPDDDGIHHMDVASGESRLIVSIGAMSRYQREPNMEGATHWFNHLQFNPSGTRFIFLHRWRHPGAPSWSTRLFTAAPDGTGIYLLGNEGMVSHFDWRDDTHVLAWSRHHGQDHYHLYTDCSDEVTVIGEDVFSSDGHCSYSPDRRYILTDTYPDEEHNERTLIVYRPASNTRYDIGRFYSPPGVTGEIRCDLHPRWSRDGKQVCFDSVHEGTRHVYIADVAQITTP